METLASPPRVRAGDVLRQQLDRLDVDRAAEPGLQPARAARVVDARATLERNCADPLRDRLHHLFGGAREVLALLGPSDQRTERAIAQRDAVEAAVEQRIGNAGLLLHAFGERDIGRARAADVEDEVGLERQHDLEIGGVAAPGDASHLRPAADVGQQELALLRPVGARPAEQQLGRQRVEKDRRRRPRRKHALDPRRHRHRAAGAVGHDSGARPAWSEQRGGESRDQRATIDAHVAVSLARPVIAVEPARRSRAWRECAGRPPRE